MKKLRTILLTGLVWFVLLEGILRLVFTGGSFGNITLLPYPILTDGNRAALSALIEKKTHYLQADNQLGWSIMPNGESPDGLYRSNSAGIRADREYTKTPPPGVARIVTYGDSFTHCDDVPNDKTWQHYMEKGSRALEVLNFGVLGYGTDQALLRFEKTVDAWYPDVAIMGFMVDNIGRNVNRFSPFRGLENIPLLKPRFIIDEGNTLSILTPPFSDPREYLSTDSESFLNTVKIHDLNYDSLLYQKELLDLFYLGRLVRTLIYQIKRRGNQSPRWASFYEDEEALRVTEYLLGRFVLVSQQKGIRPLIVIFPDRYGLEIYQKTRKEIWRQLLNRLNKAGLPYIDLTGPLSEYLKGRDDSAAHFLPHYSPAMNKKVAEVLIEKIKTFQALKK